MKEVDYVSRVNSGGGSKIGRDVRKCPRKLKEAARIWAITSLCKGNESAMIHNPNAGTRFSAKAYEPLIPILKQLFPAECEEYFGGRWERAANIIANRVHKMYYQNDGKLRGRGKSKEHPDNWEPSNVVMLFFRNYEIK